MFTNSHVMVSFLEDLPYTDKRIEFPKDGNEIHLPHRLPPTDIERLDTFRQRIKA